MKEQERKRVKLTASNGGGPINNPDLVKNNNKKAVKEDADKKASSTSKA